VILIDTNVVSEVMKPLSDPIVRAWFDAQNRQALFLSSITVAELRYGISVLPKGRRQDELSGAFDDVLALLDGRVIAFDSDAAERYAKLAAAARAAGRPVPVLDGYIAAVAALHGMTVATRDCGPFQAAGLATINPWTGGR
jgi:toxin FitB